MPRLNYTRPRRYSTHEWLDFVSEPGIPSAALRAQAARFERACTAVFPESPHTPAELACAVYNTATGSGGTGVEELDLDRARIHTVAPGTRHRYYTRDGYQRATLAQLAEWLDYAVFDCRERGEYARERARGYTPAEARARVRG